MPEPVEAPEEMTVTDATSGWTWEAKQTNGIAYRYRRINPDGPWKAGSLHPEVQSYTSLEQYHDAFVRLFRKLDFLMADICDVRLRRNQLRASA